MISIVVSEKAKVIRKMKRSWTESDVIPAVWGLDDLIEEISVEPTCVWEITIEALSQQKLAAVKVVRAVTYWGIKEAKDFVESMMVSYTTYPNTKFRVITHSPLDMPHT